MEREDADHPLSQFRTQAITFWKWDFRTLSCTIGIPSNPNQKGSASLNRELHKLALRHVGSSSRVLPVQAAKVTHCELPETCLIIYPFSVITIQRFNPQSPMFDDYVGMKILRVSITKLDPIVVRFLESKKLFFEKYLLKFPCKLLLKPSEERVKALMRRLLSTPHMR
ncbi:hypothetical protein CRG98_018099 [Punica granatum]|uniref:Uncharacterized protein n=1 Tax=Punica granatum TaxID=22663 RepID=A0A2I0JYY0_PUNGR|nr:hypothetical protein CRG98_018099 [Punica granatum]